MNFTPIFCFDKLSFHSLLIWVSDFRSYTTRSDSQNPLHHPSSLSSGAINMTAYTPTMAVIGGEVVSKGLQ